MANRHKVQLKIDELFLERVGFDKLGWIKRFSGGKEALDYCIGFACDILGRKPPMLVGPSGCGKTHLLWAAALKISSRHNELVAGTARDYADFLEYKVDNPDAENRKYIFPSLALKVTDGSEIAHEIRSSVAKANLDDVIEGFRQEREFRAGHRCILFIDDVEVAKMSDWLHEELYRIFNRRYACALPTFITTNLNPDELRAHLGDRITRRLIDMTEPFVIGRE